MPRSQVRGGQGGSWLPGPRHPLPTHDRNGTDAAAENDLPFQTAGMRTRWRMATPLASPGRHGHLKEEPAGMEYPGGDPHPCWSWAG